MKIYCNSVCIKISQFSPKKKKTISLQQLKIEVEEVDCVKIRKLLVMSANLPKAKIQLAYQ